MVLKDLVGGSAYSVKLLDELIASQGGLPAIDATGTLHGQATQNEPITQFTVSSTLMLGFVAWLTGAPRNLKVNLHADQLAVLQAGVDVEDTWPDMHDMRPGLPAWVTMNLYAGFMGATQAALLKQYGQAQRLMNERPGDANRTALGAIRTQVVAAILPAILAMESVRQDKLLAKEPAYRVLWDLPVLEVKQPTEVALANANNPAPLRAGLFFLLDAHANPGLARSAPTDAGARKQLLERFKRQLGTQGIPADGDFVLHDGPVQSSRPPLPSSMTTYPALEPPFFDTPKGGDREFVMNVAFSDVFEAFRGYVYQWELIQVPHNDIDQLSNTADTLSNHGDSPGQLAVLGNRLGRDAQYGSADIRRSIQEFIERDVCSDLTRLMVAR